MAPPSPSGSVSPIYDPRQAHRDMQDTWSESSADTQWSSSFPMPTVTSASTRPDGHPERDDSLPHFDNHPAGQYTGRLHRQTLWPTVETPRPATSSAAAPATPATPVSRPAFVERVDGFLMALPLSAVDKAADSGISAARRLGRAVSKRVVRRDTTVLVPEPVIGLPDQVQFNPKHKLMSLSLAATDSAAAARRHEVWLASLPPVRPSRSPPSSPVLRPATAVPAAVPRPGAQSRKVIESTWGDICQEANPAGTIKGYDSKQGRPVPEMQRSPPPTYATAIEMTSTLRKPAPPTININKPLPESPRPDSLRRQTIMRRRTVRNASEVTSSGHDDDGTYLYGPRVGAPMPAIPASDLQHSAHPDRQPQEGRFRADNGSDDGHPFVDQFVRAGHVSTYVHHCAGQKVDSWHMQHAVTPTSPESEGSSEDGAAAVWRKMEEDSGISMRD